MQSGTVAEVSEAACTCMFLFPNKSLYNYVGITATERRFVGCGIQIKKMLYPQAQIYQYNTRPVKTPGFPKIQSGWLLDSSGTRSGQQLFLYILSISQVVVGFVMSNCCRVFIDL